MFNFTHKKCKLEVVTVHQQVNEQNCMDVQRNATESQKGRPSACAAAWTDLEDTLLSEASQSQRTSAVRLHFRGVPRGLGVGGREEVGYYLTHVEFLFGTLRRFCVWTVVMGT